MSTMEKECTIQSALTGNGRNALGKVTLFVVFCAIATTLLSPFSSLPALLLLLVALHGMKSSVIWRPASGLGFILLAWLIWLPLTIFWSLSIGLSLERLAPLLCLPLAYVIWTKGSASNPDDRYLPGLLWLLSAILVLWGLLQGPSTYTGIPQGPFNDPNTYAGVLNLLMLPLVADYLTKNLALSRSEIRIAYLAMFAAIALVFFLVASRGATLALLLTAPAIVLISRKQPDWNRKLVLLVISIAVAYFCADWIKSGDRDVFQRLLDTTKTGDSIRIMLMQSAFAMIQETPWIGSGLGSFQLLYPKFRSPTEVISGGGWVHNDYLQLWQEAGLPMLIILFGLLLWLVNRIWRLMHSEPRNRNTIMRLGYLAGVFAISLQAATNFMFYYSFIALLVGLFLAQSDTLNNSIPKKIASNRSWNMAGMGYISILSFLFFGQTLSHTLLNYNSPAAKAWSTIFPTTSRYETAYWLSILAPFHFTPQQTMANELGEMVEMLKSNPDQRQAFLIEALWRYDMSQRLAPCYMPFGTDALYLSVTYANDLETIARGERQAASNLHCNPHHGLSHYYAGLLAEKKGNKKLALEIWKSGIAQATNFSDRVLLITAVLSRENSQAYAAYEMLTLKIANMMRHVERTPGTRPAGPFWPEIILKIQQLDREAAIAWGIAKPDHPNKNEN